MMHLGDNRSVKGMKIQHKKIDKFSVSYGAFFTGKYYIDYLYLPYPDAAHFW